MLRIEELRKQKQLTQKELADIMLVKNYTVGNWEQGRTEPSVNDLIALANFFECSIDYLVGREDDFGNVVTISNLNEEQVEILGAYETLSKERKKIIRALLKEIAL